ncbi:MAG: flagellar biosynthesis protein FlhB [Treponema sp.]|nr:flagellar biosynthesis protein FlhB [Treponema sp.]
MAAEDEGRTEEPSEYKLEQARKEGRVAKSQEVSSALVILLCVVMLIFLGRYILSQCIQIYTFYFNKCHDVYINDPKLMSFFLVEIFKIVIPVALVGALAAFIGNVIQTRGIVFSLKPIQPKFSNIIPRFGEFFRKTLFSGKGLFNIAKSMLKVTVIVIIAFFLISDDIYVLIEIIKNGQIFNAIGKIATMAAKLLLIVAVLFLVISIPDYFIQRREFRESMKMTKQEVKEEYKELEGDPEVKSRLRQMQQQLLSQNIPKAVAASDVVITNPTHFAVALKYDVTQGDEAPKVTAKGEDQLALTMRRIATENNVPIVENKPVARGLYTETQVGAIIPETYYKAISLIYSHLDKYSS